MQKHEANMEHWPGYRRNYIAAARHATKHEIQSHEVKLKYVNAQLKAQQNERPLEETIQSNQYV